MGLAQLYCYRQVKVAWNIAKTHKFLAHPAYTLVYEGAMKTLLHRDETSHLAAFYLSVTLASLTKPVIVPCGHSTCSWSCVFVLNSLFMTSIICSCAEIVKQTPLVACVWNALNTVAIRVTDIGYDVIMM